MMMDVLGEIVRQTNGLVDTLRITGSATETCISGCDADKITIVNAVLKEPVIDFVGDFGVPNLGLLRGLLDFAPYRADGSSFSVKRRMRGDREIVEEFQFRDQRGIGADYRLMSPDGIGAKLQSTVAWDVNFEPEKEKIAQFNQLAGLYNEVEKTFGVKTEKGNLVFQLGNDNSSTHRAAIVVAEGMKGVVKNTSRWSIQKFQGVMKLVGARSSNISLSKGILGIATETTYGTYTYYLIGENRG